MTFKKNYFLLTLLLFVIEICIALFVHDKFIRPFIGDLLVVILIYTFLKTFWDAPPKQVAIIVLIFAFGTEFLQYFNIVERLGIEKGSVLAIVIGSTFDWLDLLAYSLGIGGVLWVESRK